RPANLLRKEVGRRVVPQDAPGIDGRIVNAQGRAIPIAGAGQLIDAGLAVLQTWNHPHVLNGPSFEDPASVNLTLSIMRCPVFRKCRYVQFPVADEPSIERKLVGALPVRAGCVKYMRK